MKFIGSFDRLENRMNSKKIFEKKIELVRDICCDSRIWRFVLIILHVSVVNLRFLLVIFRYLFVLFPLILVHLALVSTLAFVSNRVPKIRKFSLSNVEREEKSCFFLLRWYIFRNWPNFLEGRVPLHLIFLDVILNFAFSIWIPDEFESFQNVKKKIFVFTSFWFAKRASASVTSRCFSKRREVDERCSWSRSGGALHRRNDWKSSNFLHVTYIANSLLRAVRK